MPMLAGLYHSRDSGGILTASDLPACDWCSFLSHDDNLIIYTYH